MGVHQRSEAVTSQNGRIAKARDRLLCAAVVTGVDEDVALVDEGPETGAGERGQALREPDVEAQARGVLGGDERVRRPESRPA
jgi:hypothetical protein